MRLFLKSFCLGFVGWLLAGPVMSQHGVRGSIVDENGEPLAYATIFVKQTGTGTTANIEGRFEIPLSAGRYELVFQHLGRKSESRVVNVESGYIDVDVVLHPQEIVLQTITVDGNDEDPAYTIIRKAIARADYHRNVLNSYTGRVYIKGRGKLIDYPWLAKRAMEKEGIEKGRVFISESVSEISYTRPNKFEERVISIRSDGNDNNTSPNGYIFGSFYEPEIAGTISPLSPRAFAYYTFEYQGSFREGNYEVSRIRVKPRSKGDNVVDGTLFIVEDDWSIHSLDLHVTRLGIDIGIKSMCAAIEEKAWLPVSHQFQIEGKVFGFAFEYEYLASVANYKIEINPDIYVPQMRVIDEKIERERAKEAEEHMDETNARRDNTAVRQRLESGQEITRKDLKKILREYERDERKQRENPEVISEVTFKIDSTAHRKDSLYWAEVRPIPLTREEIIGYQKLDSIAAVAQKREAGDTLKDSKHQGFQPWDLITGDRYKVGERSRAQIYFPMPGFNAVEGWNLVYRVAFGTIFNDSAKTQFRIRPVARYAFASGKLSGYLNTTLRNDRHNLVINAGRYVTQFNEAQPILPLVNTFTTLFLERNLMKIYERDFVDLNYVSQLSPFFSVATHWSLSDRRELFNRSDFKIVDRRSIEGYTPNRPESAVLIDAGFPRHQALTGSLALTARPWLKFRVRNGKRVAVEESSPSFTVFYKRGFDGIAGSDVDFDQIELGIRHRHRFGVRGLLDFWFRGGRFTNNSRMHFMDYQHFLGNETPFSTSDPIGGFRLLSYYLHSTNDQYFSANIHYKFRKLLVTTMPMVRLAGIRENVFLNYLATPTSDHYAEIGYSLDGILRIFRLEGAVSFRDFRYADFGFRIGLATALTVNFGD